MRKRRTDIPLLEVPSWALAVEIRHDEFVKLVSQLRNLQLPVSPPTFGEATVGRFLMDMRVQKRLSRIQSAQAAGLNPAWLLLLEAGVTDVSAELRAAAIKRILDVYQPTSIHRARVQIALAMIGHPDAERFSHFAFTHRGEWLIGQLAADRLTIVTPATLPDQLEPSGQWWIPWQRRRIEETPTAILTTTAAITQSIRRELNIYGKNPPDQAVRTCAQRIEYLERLAGAARLMLLPENYQRKTEPQIHFAQFADGEVLAHTGTNQELKRVTPAELGHIRELITNARQQAEATSATQVQTVVRELRNRLLTP